MLCCRFWLLVREWDACRFGAASFDAGCPAVSCCLSCGDQCVLFFDATSYACIYACEVVSGGEPFRLERVSLVQCLWDRVAFSIRCANVVLRLSRWVWTSRGAMEACLNHSLCLCLSFVFGVQDGHLRLYTSRISCFLLWACTSVSCTFPAAACGGRGGCLLLLSPAIDIVDVRLRAGVCLQQLLACFLWTLRLLVARGMRPTL